MKFILNIVAAGLIFPLFYFPIVLIEKFMKWRGK